MARKSNNTAGRVFDLARPVVNGLGLSLWDVRLEKEGANWILRVVIDKDGGVTLNDCENVSRALDPVLDEEDPIEQSYFLEVSSPGIERELTKKEHFEKYEGKPINIRLVRPLDDNRDFCGKLIGFDDKTVSVSCKSGEYMFDIRDCAFIRSSDDAQENSN